jgi:hypothetical protein
VTPAQTVRLVARLYAALSVLGGLLVLFVVWALVSAFGSKDVFDPKFLSFIVIAGVLPVALAPFIWRGRPWAMFAVLAIALGVTFLLSRQTSTLQVLLPATTALFALLTGVRMWLGER